MDIYCQLENYSWWWISLLILMQQWISTTNLKFMIHGGHLLLASNLWLTVDIHIVCIIWVYQWISTVASFLEAEFCNEKVGALPNFCNENRKDYQIFVMKNAERLQKFCNGNADRLQCFYDMLGCRWWMRQGGDDAWSAQWFPHTCKHNLWHYKSFLMKNYKIS